ncbi:MAG TPA: hypothetical protein VFB14_25040 [Bryobacteraceae bacterium]|nr:hypothetical protein [Bryobacteraceae bacterium]
MEKKFKLNISDTSNNATILWGVKNESRSLLLAYFVLLTVAPAFAQKLHVKVLNRQDNETDYTYVVPGYFNSNSAANVNCLAAVNTVNCNGSARTTALNMPAQQVSYHVRGATFSLELPDGRVAVVNCESKFAERFAGPRGNHRSCRMPLVDEIEADFNKDKAKLIWPVSIDGKTMASETYKLIAVLPKPVETRR